MKKERFKSLLLSAFLIAAVMSLTACGNALKAKAWGNADEPAAAEEDGKTGRIADAAERNGAAEDPQKGKTDTGDDAQAAAEPAFAAEEKADDFAGGSEGEVKPAEDHEAAKDPAGENAAAASEKQALGKSEEKNTENSGAEIPFAYQDVRINYVYRESYPQPFWISSSDELTDYYENNKEKYGLKAFAEAVKEYDAAFFAENDLLVVTKVLGSGSFRLEAAEVRLAPAEGGSVLKVRANIVSPYCHTDDMAARMLLIVIPKESGKAAVSSAEIAFGMIVVNGRTEDVFRDLEYAELVNREGQV